MLKYYLFYGCFPKFFGHYVRDKKLLNLETAVRKCTLLPATSMGIKGRGKIAENFAADIVVFDYEKIGTTADFKNPDRYPTGIDHVIINGKLAVENGVYNPLLQAGGVLRR